MAMLPVSIEQSKTELPTPWEIREAFEGFVTAEGFRLVGDWKDKVNCFETRLAEGKDKGRETSAKARVYTDHNYFGGWIKAWRGTERYITWKYLDTLEAGSAKYQAYTAAMPTPEEQERIRKARQEREEREAAEARQKARDFYENIAQPFNGTHEYLKKKHVKAYGAIKRSAEGDLIIPLYLPSDFKRIVSYQRIAADGQKRFAVGCSTKGAVFVIGDPSPDKPLGLAEGYATAASVYEATEIPIVVCFNCGNLTEAAASIKQNIKAADYLIFADNDRANAERADLRCNHGLEAAEKAGIELKVDAAHVIAPEAAEGCNVDWNDRAAMLDAEEYKAELDAKIRYAAMNKTERRGVDALKTLKPPMIDRIADITATRGQGFNLEWRFYNNQGHGMKQKMQGLTIIAARTGGGKTITLANIAARAIRINPEAHVLFLSLEEAEESVLYRILGAYIAQGALDYCGSIANAPTVQEIQRAIEGRGEGWKNSEIEADRDKWGAIIAAMNAMEQRLLVADLINSPNLRDVDFTTALCSAFFKQHRENAVICIDYLQMLQPSGQSSGDYRDFKRVMSRIKELIAARVNIFAGAQLNRQIADAKISPEVEFDNAIPEQIREAADIEQAAELIIFAKMHSDASTEAAGAPYANFRILKNRRGANDLAMSMPVNFERGVYYWTEQRESTFRRGVPFAAPTDIMGNTSRVTELTQDEYRAICAFRTAIRRFGTIDANDGYSPEAVAVDGERWKEVYCKDYAKGGTKQAQTKAFNAMRDALKAKQAINYYDRSGLYTFGKDYELEAAQELETQREKELERARDCEEGN